MTKNYPHHAPYLNSKRIWAINSSFFHQKSTHKPSPNIQSDSGTAILGPIAHHWATKCANWLWSNWHWKASSWCNTFPTFQQYVILQNSSYDSLLCFLFCSGAAKHIDDMLKSCGVREPALSKFAAHTANMICQQNALREEERTEREGEEREERREAREIDERNTRDRARKEQLEA